jgi:hypothetical protein
MFLIFITIAFLRHVTARQAKRRSIFTDMSKLFRAMSEEVTASSYPIGSEINQIFQFQAVLAIFNQQ